MDTPTTTTPPQNVKFEFRKAPGYRHEYANSVNLQVTTWDFQFTFGLIEQTSGDSFRIDESTRVYLSPQQAKALSNILSQNVQQYERQFGAIAIEPPGLVNLPPGAGKPQ